MKIDKTMLDNLENSYKLWDETALNLEKWLYKQGFKRGDFSIIHKSDFNGTKQVFFKSGLEIKPYIWEQIRELGYN